MKHPALKIFGVLLVFCLVAVLIVRHMSAEPSYEGRPLSDWVQDLNSDQSEKRQAAAKAIRAMGSESVPRLSGEVDSEGGALRGTARKVGKFFPDKARAAARKVLGWDKTQMERVAAAKAIFILGTNANRSIPALTNAMRDANTLVAYHAALALSQMPDAVMPLVAALDDQDFTIRAHACVALQALGPQATNAAPRLMQILQTEAGAITAAASHTLLRMGPEAIPWLTNGLNYTNADTRRHCANILKNMDAAALPAVPALTRAANDPDPVVRQAVMAAIRGIDRLTAEADPVLVAALEDPELAVRLEAMEALQWRPRTVRHNREAIEKQLNSTNERMSILARSALEKFPPLKK